MSPRRPLLAFIALLLPLTACRKAEVTSYRIPKEHEADASAATATNPDMAGTAVPTATGSDLAWTAPSDWIVKAPSAMRKGSYTVKGDGNAEADLSITAFPGDVGGEIANLNRWRGQLELPPLSETDLATAVTRSEHNGLKLATADFSATGSDDPQRILGAIVPFAGATWFFKLMGPVAVVEKAKPAFQNFLATIHPFSAVEAVAVSPMPPPPEPAPVAPMGPAGTGMAGTTVPTAGGPSLVWTAPAHWRASPGSAMRKGSFEIPGAGGANGDLSITAFPGDVGGELANVNRWRGQVQLPPVGDADLGTAIIRVTQNNLNFAIVDFTAPGADSQGILGAIVPFAGATWFFKLSGPATLLAREKPAFLEFLKTVRAP